MIAVLSPAKNLVEEKHVVENYTLPRHLDQSQLLINKLRKQSRVGLRRLMGISADLAALNLERYQNYQEEFNTKNSNPAIYMFMGDAYRTFDVRSMNEKAIEYTQNHLRILSGLYGILRPLDLIQPYRLEMGTSLPVRRKKNLYEFWGALLTQTLNEDLNGSKVIINLASDEYWSSIKENDLIVPVVKAVFKDFHNGKLKVLSFNAKRARGLMARFIMEKQLKEAEEIQSFNGEGYTYDESLSSKHEYVFTR